MFHRTFHAQKIRSHVAGQCAKNNTPLLRCRRQSVFEPRNEPQITFAPKRLHYCHVKSHMHIRYSALSVNRACGPWCEMSSDSKTSGFERPHDSKFLRVDG